MAYEGVVTALRGGQTSPSEQSADVGGGIPEVPAPAALSKSKRALDVVVSAVAIALLFPALVLIALIVRLESPGPAIFRQRRTGLCGRPFVIYKFRSMRSDTSAGSNAPAVRGDPRITRFGALLRRSSLDELPQLINVLKGDMSLVGPRPHAVDHDALYMAQVPGYAERFRVKPGITGLSQVNGSRGGGDPFEIRRRSVLDARYIAEWSFLGDIKIIVLTPAHLLLYRAH